MIKRGVLRQPNQWCKSNGSLLLTGRKKYGGLNDSVTKRSLSIFMSSELSFPHIWNGTESNFYLRVMSGYVREMWESKQAAGLLKAVEIQPFPEKCPESKT